MYYWIALRLNENYGNNIKAKCKELNKLVLVDEKSFNLPAHISLKISFESPINDELKLLNLLLSIVRKYLPLKVTSSHIELNNNIIWTLFEKNKTLINIHSKLDEELMKIGVNQHPFDECFIFHSTLFMDENINKINNMYELIKHYDVKQEHILDTIIIGKSNDGINYEVIINEKV